jgi:hypothetical protein
MVRHLEDAAHIRGLLPVEEEVGLGRVGVGIAGALEKPERGERVEKVPGRPRMQAEPPAESLEFSAWAQRTRARDRKINR